MLLEYSEHPQCDVVPVAVGTSNYWCQ